MNVRRTTGSWWWFTAAVLGDGLKGLVPVFVAKLAIGGGDLAFAVRPWGQTLSSVNVLWWAHPVFYVPMAAVVGSVLGHNYSIWMAVVEKRFERTGKGLATGAGALLAYDWRCLIVVLVLALAVIAVTRYMMAGQVAAAFALPIAALLFRSPDWPFLLLMGALVYSAHHKRFVGLLQGREPKLYINDRSGPRG
jgi:glycerol-3-phosphate acyltransferase PlsY